MACVGMVGGLGVGATVHYYEKITAACKARGVIPDLVIVHADVDRGQGFVREGKLDELTARIRLPLINIVESIGVELRARRLRRVALFGTTFTMDGSLWGQLQSAAPGVEIVKPRPDEIAFVGKAYQRILDTKTGDADDTAGLRRIAADLQRRDGVEAILLAGTDLAVIFDEATAGFPCIDVARVHIDAIVERLTV